MKYFSTIPFALLFMVTLLGSSVYADGWQVGTAKANMTPTKPLWMAGYAGRDHPAEGKRTDLWAKTLVLVDSTGNRGVLITLDLVGISRPLASAICDELIAKHKLARKNIALCVSHTHTGPVVGRNLESMQYSLLAPDQQKAVDAYADELKSKIVASVGEALKNVEACSLHQAIGKATFAVNRRENRPESNVPKWRFEGKLKGPVNHDVPVLAVRNEAGDFKAVVFGYACHSTVLSDYQWSGDYPGFAQIELEKLYPTCQAMFWAGCGADQNPLPRRTPTLAQHYGRRLATAVDSVLLTTKMAAVESSLQTKYREIDLELGDLPSTDAIEAAAKSNNRYEQSRAKLLLAKIEKNGKLSPTYPYPIGVWKLGDNVSWVFLGGEVVVDYANRLQAESKQPLWVAGYSNDIMAYIASRRVIAEGGYEGGGAMLYYGLPTAWAPTIENAIVEEVHRQLNANKSP